MFETAELLASWPFYDPQGARRFVLGPPMIPAQENFEPLDTFNPTFELEYWRFGLATAQDVAQAARHAEGSEVGQRAVPAVEAAGEGRPLSRRRVAAGSVGSRASAAMLEGQHRARMPEPRSSVVRRRARAAAGMGRDRATMRRTLEAVIEGLGSAPDLGLGLADAGDDGGAAR